MKRQTCAKEQQKNDEDMFFIWNNVTNNQWIEEEQNGIKSLKDWTESWAITQNLISN